MKHLRHEFKQLLTDTLKLAKWPKYIIEWHVRRLTITYTNGKTICNILNNVNCPWRPTGCNCEAIKKRLQEAKCPWSPPTVNGHIFFTGREFEGPHKKCLHINNGNIPTSAFWDIKRTIGNAKKEIPFDIPDSVWERHSKHLLRQ